MSTCICLVQEGQIPDDVRSQLEGGVTDIVKANALGEQVNFAWIDIAKGDGWTAGKPSTSSVVTLRVPPIEQAQREQILSAFCDMWTATSGCHINEIVVSVMSAD